jgi:hypothetical protein
VLRESRKKIFVSVAVLLVLLLGVAVLRQGAGIAGIVSAERTEKISPKVAAKSTADWLAEVEMVDFEKGVRLAKARGGMMRELIRTDPERAIQESLSLSEWSMLPPEIQALVEQPFSTVANVEVLIACGENFSETSITTEFPDAGKMETYVYGRRGGVASKVGIPVQGIRVGDVGALREHIFQSLETDDEQTALMLYPVAVEKQGEESVAALAGGRIFYFENSSALAEANRRLAKLEELPGPSAGAQALFQPLEAYALEDGGIDFQALEEIAYAASTAWTGSPRNMYVIMCDFSDNAGQPADPAVFSNALNGTVSQQIREMSYEKTHIIGTVNPTTYRLPSPSTTYTNNSSLLHSDAESMAVADGVDLSSYETICVLFSDVAALSWAGLASVGGQNMWLNGTINSDVVIHEFGHNYGLSHAATWTNSVSSNPVEPAPVGGKVEYGDFTDIMGGGDAPEGHFNAWHKKKVGWFDTDNWQSITTSGTYRVYRSDHYRTTGLLRGLEIEKSAGDYYWVGLRQEYTGYETFGRGAYLLWKKSGDNRSYLLDTSPLSAEGKYDGGLALGQTYSDTAAAVCITPTARGGQTPNEWMDITVNLGSFPGNTAPTASISGPTSLAIQAGALFSVTASDVDGDELAYFWDTGDGLVKPNAPTIATTWLSGSTVAVSCVVSDMKGGTNKVSQNVVLSSPLNNWTQRTSGTTRDIMDIALGNGRLVAVADDETTLYSDDGTNWTSHTNYNVSAGNIFLKAVIYDGSRFVACGMDYDFGQSGWEQTIYTSSDGTSWTERYDSDSGSSSNVRLTDLAYGNGVYVAIGSGGTMVRSSDSINWSPVTYGSSETLDAISYGDGVFVAVGDGGNLTPHLILTSPDGLTWTDQSAGTSLYAGYWVVAVAYCNDRFLAGGWNSEALYSTNQGQSFVSELTGSYDLTVFSYGNGIYFAAGRDIANAYADINLVSLDGVNWSELSTADQDDRNAAVFFNGTFITVGDNGSIWQSDAVSASSGGFATWQLENRAELGFNRDPLDDADFDGFVNLEEYARGTSASDAGAIPSDVMYEADGAYFQVSYGRTDIKSDIDYTVERAVNLFSNDWDSASTVVMNDDATNLTVRSAHTIASQTNEFMRLELELK